MSDKKTVWQPNEEQRGILEALLAESAQEKSVAEFARKFLPFGRSKFDQMTDALDETRLENGERKVSYFDKISPESIADTFEELRFILDEVPRKRAEYSRISETKILKTSKIRAVETAVRECTAKPGPERVVVCAMPTGAGKTMIANFLVQERGARLVEVRSAWRRSETGFVPLSDICKAVGLRVKPGTNMATIEDKLVKFCDGRNIVLCCDEGEHFGRAALNLIKFLMNKTRIVVVILVVTNEYEKWDDYFPNEAGQISRRTHAIVEASSLTGTKEDLDDVGLFFPADAFKDRAASIERIAREASVFGHFSLVSRIAKRLANVVQAEETDVKKAISLCQRQMRREANK